MSHLDRIPGLVRMITVDNNTLPGRLEELPLDDHTVVLAKNGSGKTSLIQLVPIFYLLNRTVGFRSKDPVHSWQSPSHFFYRPNLT